MTVALGYPGLVLPHQKGDGAGVTVTITSEDAGVVRVGWGEDNVAGGRGRWDGDAAGLRPDGARPGAANGVCAQSYGVDAYGHGGAERRLHGR